MRMREMLTVVVRDKWSLHALRRGDITSCNVTPEMSSHWPTNARIIERVAFT